jgi:hypothetical protein
MKKLNFILFMSLSSLFLMDGKYIKTIFCLHFHKQTCFYPNCFCLLFLKKVNYVNSPSFYTTLFQDLNNPITSSSSSIHYWSLLRLLWSFGTALIHLQKRETCFDLCTEAKQWLVIDSREAIQWERNFAFESSLLLLLKSTPPPL